MSCILILVILLLLVTICIYNTMLSKKNKLLKAYSSLDVMLKKRYDLIPNIVEIVKEYKEYESSTIEKVIQLRKNADNCNNINDMENIAQKYNSFISDINILSENYPQLKSSDNFIHLQKILSEVEEEISAARRTYNAHVEKYNTYISYVPINIFAKIFNFEKYDFFEASKEERNFNYINK